MDPWTWFLSHDTIDILVQIILCWGCCSVYQMMFSSIPGFSLLDARRISCPSRDTQNVSKHGPMSPRV